MPKNVTPILVGLALVFSATLVGCGPNSESMCKKLEALEEKSPKKDKDKDADDKKDPKEKHADCVKNFDHVKEVSPEGYKKIATCVDMSDADAAGGCLFGVMLGDEKLKAESEKDMKKAMDDAEKKSKQDEEDKKKKSADKIAGWPGLATKNVDGKLKSYSGDNQYTNFTIQLPEKFEADPKASTETMIHYEMKGESDDPFFIGPSITIMQGLGAPDLDAELKVVEATKQNVVKKDKTDKGYVIETDGDLGVEVKVSVKNGENSIECSAHLYGDEQKAAKDKLMPWLEKLCTSIAIK